MSAEKKRKIIPTTYNILHFLNMYSILPKIMCLRRWEKTSLHHDNTRQCFLFC